MIIHKNRLNLKWISFLPWYNNYIYLLGSIQHTSSLHTKYSDKEALLREFLFYSWPHLSTFLIHNTVFLLPSKKRIRCLNNIYVVFSKNLSYLSLEEIFWDLLGSNKVLYSILWLINIYHLLVHKFWLCSNIYPYFHLGYHKRNTQDITLKGKNKNQFQMKYFS